MGGGRVERCPYGGGGGLRIGKVVIIREER